MAKQTKRPSSGRRPARAGVNSSTTERIQIKLSQRLFNKTALVVASAFLGVLIVVLTGIFLFYKVYADPQRVFWSMINNNLATDGVTKQTITTQNGSKTNETIQMNLSPEIRLHDVKAVVNASNKSSLTLDIIGTVNADYERYSYISRPGKATQADYQKVYKLWLKNGGSQTGAAQTINSALFGAVLFGNLNSAQRSEVMGLLRDSYQVDFAGVLKQTDNGRRTYVYQARVPLKKYAIAARKYAQIEGLPVASQINPASYTDASQLQVKITVDVLSRQIRQIQYSQQHINEIYSGYGVRSAINIPAKTVSSTEFEQVINSVIK